MSYNFNAKEEAVRLVEWIREYFKENGPTSEAVIGISGGKDSSVVAALCIAALGKDRVVGIQMPNTNQRDIQDSHDVISHFGIKKLYVNIGPLFNSVVDMAMMIDPSGVIKSQNDPNSVVRGNLLPRIRMTCLYLYANSYGARVSCNSNLSESYIGWSTQWGDNVGDFAPIANLTCTEVREIGRTIGLPERFINKIPEDGLTGRTDEDNFGFTYDQLDRYIRGDSSIDPAVIAKIEAMHARSEFKRRPFPRYEPQLT